MLQDITLSHVTVFLSLSHRRLWWMFPSLIHWANRSGSVSSSSSGLSRSCTTEIVYWGSKDLKCVNVSYWMLGVGHEHVPDYCDCADVEHPVGRSHIQEVDQLTRGPHNPIHLRKLKGQLKAAIHFFKQVIPCRLEGTCSYIQPSTAEWCALRGARLRERSCRNPAGRPPADLRESFCPQWP